MFLEAQVRCATETSSRQRVAFSTKGEQQLWKKSTRVLQSLSRREAVTRFVTDLEVEEAPVRDAVQVRHGGGQHVALPARRVINDVVLM